MIMDRNDVKRLASGKSSEFVFKLKNGLEIAKASGIKEFISRVRSVAVESLEYHTYNGHFGSWLRHFNRFELAERVDALTSKGEELRQDILRMLRKI